MARRLNRIAGLALGTLLGAAAGLGLALASARPLLQLWTYDSANQIAQAGDRLLLSGVLLGAVLGLGLVWRAGRTAP